MDEMTALRGRLDALEFMLSTVLADALSVQPDVGSALRLFRNFYYQKAADLQAGAGGAERDDRLRAIAFADALTARTSDVITTVGAITCPVGPAN